MEAKKSTTKHEGILKSQAQNTFPVITPAIKSEKQKQRFAEMNPSSSKQLSMLPLPERSRLTFQQRISGYDDSDPNKTPEKLKVQRVLCVRCSDPASICMQCSESMVENALSFYKETRARGAMALFQNAITNAGAAKVLRFVIFTTWRNGFLTRSALDKKRAFIAELRHRKTVTKAPFEYWKIYISDKKNERMTKASGSLQERITFLEAQIKQLEMDKSVAERNESTMQNELKQRTLLMEIQNSGVLKLHEEIVRERLRVIGLISLSEPLNSLVEAVDEASVSEANALQNMLQSLTNRSAVPDYSRLFDLGVKDTTRQLRKKALTKAYCTAHNINSETKEELKLSTKVMLDWINNKSRDIGMKNESESNKPLGKLLPSFERMSEFGQLKDGRQLCRVIVSLVYDSVEGNPVHEDFRQKFSLDQLNEIKRLEDNATSLVRLSLKHAYFHLQLPLFHAEDILSGDVAVIQTLIGSLMLVAPAQKHSEDARILGAQTEQLAALKSERDAVKESLESQATFRRLKAAWSQIRDSSGEAISAALAPKEVTAVADVTPVPEAALSSSDAVARKGGGGVGRGKTINGVALSLEAAALYPFFAIGAKYEALTTAVDDFLKDQGNRHLMGVGGALVSHSRSLHKLRTELDEACKGVDEGNRVANDVRQLVFARSNAVMLRKLEWISDTEPLLTFS